MRKSDYDTSNTIIEILRDGGIDYETAVTILDEVVPLDARRDLCARLEQWWDQEHGEQADADAKANNYVDAVKNDGLALSA